MSPIEDNQVSKKKMLIELVLFAPDGRHARIDENSYRKYLAEFGIENSPVVTLLNHFYSHKKEKESTETEVMNFSQLAKLMKLIDNTSVVSGYCFFLPKGKLIYDLLLDYLDHCSTKYGYTKMDVPPIFRRDSKAVVDLTEKFMHGGGGHNGERMVGLTDGTYLRYASDPILFPWIANKSPFERKDLPLRIYTPTANFRYEREGELKLLIRSIFFTNTDLHSFAEPQKDLEEYLHIHKLNSDIMHKICSNDWFLNFDVTEEFFKENIAIIQEVVKFSGVAAIAKIMRAKTHYYSIQHQYRVSLSNGTTTQVANLQFDRVNGKRFDIKIRKEDGSIDYATIVHAAQYGRVEKVFTYLLDRAAVSIANKQLPSFPFWLSPTQVRLIPLKDSKNIEQITNLLSNGLRVARIRVDFDVRWNKNIADKIKAATKEWIPYVVVIGEKEANSRKISVRTGSTGKVFEMSIKDFLEKVVKEQDNMPCRSLPYSENVSERPALF